MRCKINDRQVPCEWLYFREFDYGRGHPTWPVVAYSASVNAETFYSGVETFYAGYAADDKATGTPADGETIRRMRTLGWPPVSEIGRQNPAVLEEFILKHVAYDVLQIVFPPYKERPRYLIDSVDEVRILDGNITLAGRALELP